VASLSETADHASKKIRQPVFFNGTERLLIFQKKALTLRELITFWPTAQAHIILNSGPASLLIPPRSDVVHAVTHQIRETVKRVAHFRKIMHGQAHEHDDHSHPDHRIQHNLAADRYDVLGQERGAKDFADNQHTTKAGARLNAESVVEGLKQLKDCPLSTYLGASAP
jgi:hypothetical protein